MFGEIALWGIMLWVMFGKLSIGIIGEDVQGKFLGVERPGNSREK